jgi:uncharacterized protein (DUF58 family)
VDALTERSRHNLKVAAAAAVPAAALGVGLWLLRHMPAALGGPQGAPGFVLSGPAQPVQAEAGKPATVTLTVTNTSGQPDTVTVTGSYVAPNGQGGSFVAQTAALQPGQSQQITLQTAGPIDPQFAGETLTATFETSDGHQVSVTFQVQAQPAFAIRVVSITSPVQPGQYAQAVVEVTNTGTASGQTTVMGVTTLNGTVEGHWQ